MKLYSEKPPFAKAWEHKTGLNIDELAFDELELPETTEAYEYWASDFLDEDDKFMLCIEMRQAANANNYENWIDHFEFEVSKIVDKVLAKHDVADEKEQGRNRALQFLVALIVDEVTRYYPYYLYYLAKDQDVDADELQAEIDQFIEAWEEDARWFNDVHEDFIANNQPNNGDNYEF